MGGTVIDRTGRGQSQIAMPSLCRLQANPRASDYGSVLPGRGEKPIAVTFQGSQQVASPWMRQLFAVITEKMGAQGLSKGSHVSSVHNKGSLGTQCKVIVRLFSMTVDTHA